ncbi:ubiquitin carboxyl-terminal hydrolase 35 [Schistocerca americana]|uniref:ubiquitin carboxyl-terminal hydrolase 35 n=1 Tax=Schistocerca americana TaxID=7009 RepID=UPI001F4F9720|nr:ubiquitin carboxyl-terminal hydrolase 35 [Schistocerca americana]
MIRDTLKNMLSSCFPQNVLENVVDALLDNGNELSSEDQVAVLHAGIDLVRNSENPRNITVGWRILRCLAKKPGVCFGSLLNATVIKDLFIGTKPPNNPQEILLLVEWCLERGSDLGLEPTVQHCLTDFLRLVSFDDKLLADVCVFLNRHPKCLPCEEELKKFCETIVACLSSFATPAAKREAIRQFHENVSKIGDFLTDALKKRQRKEIIYSCLKIVYTAIANKDDGREPSPSLAVVLGLLEPEFIRCEVKTVLDNSTSHDVVRKALQIFCHWLTVWPRATYVNLWIDALINELEEREMYSILNEVTLETIDKLFGSMQLPALRQGVETIVWHMLFSNLYNHEVFRKISPKIPGVVAQLKLENSNNASASLRFLYNYCCIMYEEIPNFKKDYEEVVKAMEELSTIRRFSRSQLSIKQWKSPLNGLMPALEVAPIYQLTGRVGLYNLGNTCYMNSILQALFMTNRFCFGLLSKEKNYNQELIWKLQTLFALLLHSKRPALSPTDLLAICRPPGFLPGHQQDSSEFLTYLLDVLHEQEARFVKRGDGKEEDNCMGSISRWTTEEDLSDGGVLERKAQSLADCSQDGTDSEKTEILSSTLSGSADSGIHSVCGDEAGVAGTLTEVPSLHLSLVHQTFGGKIVTCNECLTCHSQSVQTDTFTDLQLSFPPQEEDNKYDVLDVQNLLDYFVSAEKLSGDNCYRCDKCSALTEGQRSVNILQAPSHLILTIKHFHYDSTTMQRTKLLHKMHYNERLFVPVVAAGQQQKHCETYNLYAAVVHSGRSVDSGHYYTFSRDQSGSWFVFNDESIYPSSLDELTNLKAADTPYILFYALPSENLQLEVGSHPLENLQPHLLEVVLKDNALFIEQKKEERRRLSMGTMSKTWYNQRKPDDDPPSSCGGGSSFSTSANRVVF